MTTTLDPRTYATSPAVPSTEPQEVTLRSLAPYAIAGALLGIILVKSEVIYWYRIQEMFRFQSFQMYGIM